VSGKRSLWLDPEPPSEAEGGPFSTARWNRQAAEARELRALPPEEPPPADPPRRSRRRIVLGVAALVTAVAALGFSLAAFLSDESGNEVVGADGGRPLPDTQIGRVYDAAGPAVVSVQAGPASGTGFVVDGDGTIVTNAHVVSTATSAQVRFNDTGRLLEAEVLGADASSDLAVLRVDPGSAGRLRALRFANSDRVDVGDAVVAIGHPFGLDRTATAGIVSGVGRSIEAPDGFQIDDAIQTDAPINPGNSGGALVNMNGEVIGINSAIATQGSNGNIGVGFAISANKAKAVADQLIKGQPVSHPYLGVSIQNADNGGALIGQVEAGSPAAQAGLEVGDVVTKVGDRGIASGDDLVGAIQTSTVGEALTMTVVRNGLEQTLTATVGEQP